MPFGLGFFATAGAGGAAGSFDLLESQVLGSTAASVTFSSLSTYASTYQHLQIRAVARMSSANTERSLVLRFNADTGSNYNNHGLNGDGSSVSSFYFADTYNSIGSFAAANATANAFGVGVVDILDPFETTKNKTIRSLAGTPTTPQISLRSGLWRNTAAVSSITLLDPTSNLVTGSRFSLYGIRAV
jgi:hypothetical protein